MAMLSFSCRSRSLSLRPSCRISPLDARASAKVVVRCRPRPLELARVCSAVRCYGGPHELVEETENSSISKWIQIEKLLQRKWLMQQPNTKVSRVLVSISNEKPSELDGAEVLGNLRFSLASSDFDQRRDGPLFYVIRDDLLHPLLGGNKLRKLDALIPQLQDCNVTDVVTCGGCQSAHTAALAFACAERGITAHLLLRGERPKIPTGYNLLSSMYGHCTYLPRSEYADRSAVLKRHAIEIAGSSGTICSVDELKDCDTVEHILKKKVAIVKEGAGDSMALLGLIRLVQHLSQPSMFGCDRHFHFLVDTGTGTTATGLAFGMWLLKIPWRVTGVMLADTAEGYEVHKTQLLAAFCNHFSVSIPGTPDLPLTWEKRSRPRRFGVILPGEVRTCQTIARETGILLDPIYTLAGWEAASRLSVEADGASLENVVMLHTGGTLGLFGLAQKYPTEFT